MGIFIGTGKNGQLKLLLYESRGNMSKRKMYRKNIGKIF